MKPNPELMKFRHIPVVLITQLWFISAAGLFHADWYTGYHPQGS